MSRELILFVGLHQYIVVETADDGRYSLVHSVTYHSAAQGRSFIFSSDVLGFRTDGWSKSHTQADDLVTITGTGHSFYRHMEFFRRVHLYPTHFIAPDDESLRDALGRVVIVCIQGVPGYNMKPEPTSTT